MEVHLNGPHAFRTTRSNLAAFALASIALVFATLDPAPLQAAQADQKQILVFYAARKEGPGVAALERELQERLNSSLGGHLDYYGEYVDMARFPEPEYQAAFGEFLRSKYHHRRFDLVIATSDASLDFVESQRTELFPDAPVVFIGTPGIRRPANSTGVIAALNLRDSLRLATALQPDATQVFLVSGFTAFDRWYENLAREQLKGFDQRIALTYLSGLRMSDLEERVAHLPPRSLIYYLVITEDSTGQRFVALDPLDRVAAAANAPMYSWHDVALGHGIVGGSLIATDVLARHTAELALQVLEAGTADRIAPREIEMHVPQVDWRQLRRWDISEANVPAGTRILFRDPGLWNRYKGYVVGVISLLVLQSALIAGLIVNRVNRRRAEKSLEQSHARVRDLAGRLLRAQEAERTRIARELHDDMGQRVASVSIAVSGVKRQLADAPPQVRADLTALQLETISLAKDLRSLSHELHPAVLEHLGLVEALRTRCDEVSVEIGIPVGCHVAPQVSAGAVGGDTALCLYRVAQEALRNVAKHAAARQASVSLSRQNGNFLMSIADDGRGFDPDVTSQHRGLGLISLDERVRMLDGTLQIQSSYGIGTTISVSLPAK
jgi:signal transduction histidine kinase